MGFFKDLILRKKTSAKGEAFYCRFLGFLSLAFHLFCVDSWCYVFFHVKILWFIERFWKDRIFTADIRWFSLGFWHFLRHSSGLIVWWLWTSSEGTLQMPSGKARERCQSLHEVKSLVFDANLSFSFRDSAGLELPFLNLIWFIVLCLSTHIVPQNLIN